MNILFTDYVYPLEKKIVLSKKKKYYLDNPRTRDEILFVKNKIKDYNEQSAHLTLPPRASKEYVSLSIILKDIKAHYKEDQYLQSLFKKYFSSKSYDKIYEFIARIWIIARYDDEGESKKLEKAYDDMVKKEQTGFFLIDDDNPIEKNAKELVDYSFLLSTLIHTQKVDYTGISFISGREELYDGKSTRFIQDLMLLNFSCHMNKEDDLDWLIFPIIKKKLIEKTEFLDNFIDVFSDVKLNYIGSLLRIGSKDVSDNKIRIVLLTSIIEFLLTRNPDYNRFNVEDSINKQFQLKTAVVIHQNQVNVNLAELSSNLKLIYKLRSLIAHGNLGELNKLIARKKKSGQEYFIEDVKSLLYTYLRIILEEYLVDPVFINFLKKS